jgi:hypothetical protein
VLLSFEQILQLHVEVLRDSGSRDRAVGTGTRYGLDGPEIESPGRRRFSVLIQTFSEAHPASCTVDTVSYSGVKRPGCGADLSPPSSAEYENGLELLFCLPSVPS